MKVLENENLRDLFFPVVFFFSFFSVVFVIVVILNIGLGGIGYLNDRYSFVAVVFVPRQVVRQVECVVWSWLIFMIVRVLLFLPSNVALHSRYKVS